MNDMDRVKAESIKLRRTFTKKMPFIMPLITAFLSAFLMAGESFQEGSYNWWYALILPGMLSLICAEVIYKDRKKLNYRAILDLPLDPAKIWLGKIGICAWLFFQSCVIFFLLVTSGGFIFGTTANLDESIFASLLLFVTFLWQIPLCLFLADRLGLFVAVFLNFAANIVFIIGTANTKLWWIPYSIPARIVCPVIKVLPNGLTARAGNPLLNSNVILPGVLISLAMFAALSALTALLFRKREAK